MGFSRASQQCAGEARSWLLRLLVVKAAGFMQIQCAVLMPAAYFWLLVPTILFYVKKTTMLSSRCAQGDSKFSGSVYWSVLNRLYSLYTIFELTAQDYFWFLLFINTVHPFRVVLFQKGHSSWYAMCMLEVLQKLAVSMCSAAANLDVTVNVTYRMSETWEH